MCCSAPAAAVDDNSSTVPHQVEGKGSPLSHKPVAEEVIGLAHSLVDRIAVAAAAAGSCETTVTWDLKMVDHHCLADLFDSSCAFLRTLKFPKKKRS